MGKLYDDSIFNKRDEATKQQEKTSNRLFIIIVVLGILVVAGVAAWHWYNDPAKKTINVNTASVEELQYLPKVGPAIAKSIVAGRPYTSPEDLKKVPGIGEKTFEQMKPRVKVD